MSTFQIKYFASLRETLGIGAQTVESSAQTTHELRQYLATLSAAHAEAMAHPRLCAAVNQTMVGWDAKLVSGDEVAFFPPVTGG